MSFQTEDKTPVIFIELVDQRSSGFILDGTEGTPHQVELKAPSVRFIPNVGFRRGIKKEVINGKEVTTRFNEKIQYIRNETEISVQKQKELGILPNPISKEDKIMIEKGYATIAREGADVGLFDFFVSSYYNESNIERSQKATALYRILELDKKAEEENDDAEVEAEAALYIVSLREKIGEEYVYQTEKIDAICQMFNVISDSYPTKIKALRAWAKNSPSLFLNKVKHLSQTTITEIAHGLQLLTIKFEGNSAVYVDKNKVIKTFGAGKYTNDKKIQLLADYFNTKDGFEAYNEYKAELEHAKEKAI